MSCARWFSREGGTPPPKTPTAGVRKGLFFPWTKDEVERHLSAEKALADRLGKATQGDQVPVGGRGKATEFRSR